MLVSPPLCLPSIFRFPRLKKTRPTHTLLGPLGSPNKWKGHWLGDGEPRGFSKCISAQCPLFGRAALGNINFAISAGQVHYHYLNCLWGGTWIILAGCIKRHQKNPQFTRLDQQGKGNLQQGGGVGAKTPGRPSHFKDRGWIDLPTQSAKRRVLPQKRIKESNKTESNSVELTGQGEQRCALVVTYSVQSWNIKEHEIEYRCFVQR